MKALRTLTDYPPGSLMNPSFRYSRKVDVAKTFARVRREQARAKAAASPAAQLALPSANSTTAHD